jgi:hypothetical protein
MKEYYGIRAEALAAAGDFKRAYYSLEKNWITVQKLIRTAVVMTPPNCVNY